MRDPWPLTVPESLLLWEDVDRPATADLLDAAFIEVLVRGHLRISRRRTRGVIRPRSTWLVEHGPTTSEPPAALALFVNQLAVARSVGDLDGGRGHTVSALARAVRRRLPGTGSYLRHVLAPTLEQKGYLSTHRLVRGQPTIRDYQRTPAGRQAADEARARVAEARQAVQALERSQDDASRQQARRAAAPLLRTAGSLLVVEPDLLEAALEIERAVAEREVVATPSSMPGDVPGGELLDTGDVRAWPSTWQREVDLRDLDRVLEAVDAGAVSGRFHGIDTDGGHPDRSPSGGGSGGAAGGC